MSLIPQNTCRICEQQNSSRELLNISAPDFALNLKKYLALADVTVKQNLLSNPKVFTSFKFKIQFDIDDDLPKYFCKNCVKILNTAYDFKIQCELAHNRFLTLLKTEPIDFDTKKGDISDAEIITKHFDLNGFEIKLEDEASPIAEHIDGSSTLLLQIELNVDELPAKPFECYICQTTFVSKSNLGRHMKTQHTYNKTKTQPKRRACSLCDKTFFDQSSLGRHMKRIHFGQKIKQYVKKTACEICGQLFASGGSKTRHVNTVHKAERLFACELCDKCFGQATGLQHHVACVHSDVRNYKCDKCSKAFKTKRGLFTHRVVHLSKEERIQYRRTNNYWYNSEYRKRYYSKQKICEICGRMITASGMEGHMRIHDGLKPYACTVCQICFSTKQKLKIHSVVHTDVRRYKCDLCPKTFRQRSNLRDHLIRHSGKKPYQCSFCDKAFALPFNLRLHERIHTGEKPYKCNLCADKFTNSGALRRHATHTHPGEEATAVTLKPKQYVADKWL